MKCPHCDCDLFSKSSDGSRLKTPASILILHSTGGMEINCRSCRKGVVLPIEVRKGEIRKAQPHPGRFVIYKS